MSYFPRCDTTSLEGSRPPLGPFLCENFSNRCLTLLGTLGFLGSSGLALNLTLRILIRCCRTAGRLIHLAVGGCSPLRESAPAAPVVARAVLPGGPRVLVCSRVARARQPIPGANQ